MFSYLEVRVKTVKEGGETSKAGLSYIFRAP